jgi:geranylgeranyl diphosphate synthase, type I
MTVADSRQLRNLINNIARSEPGRLLYRELDRRWPQTSEQLDAITRYALLPAGKLLRPIMALQAAEVAGGSPADIVTAALALEYLHAATLVHDDIIDGDAVRRGRPAVPAAYGVPDAIVTGDHLIFSAFEAIVDEPWASSPARVIAAVGALAEAGRDLCRGQMLEAQLTGDIEAGARWYPEMIRLKTGALFRAACYIGATLGGAGADATAWLAGYGEHVGIAFQIRDDLASYLATPEQTGKPALSDLSNGRPTLPLLLAYQASADPERGELLAVLRRRGAGDGDADRVRELVRSAGGTAGAHRRMVEHAERAIAELRAFKRSASLDVLTGIARWTSEAL